MVEEHFREGVIYALLTENEKQILENNKQNLQYYDLWSGDWKKHYAELSLRPDTCYRVEQ